MATNELTILLKARDEATKVLQGAGKGVDQMKKAVVGAGLAIAGAGVAVDALARKQAPLLEATKKLASQTGMTEKEIRGMATSMSNATFPLESAIGLMTQASQQGLEGADALQKYANFWDTVGDATGLSAEELAKSGAALKAVGVEIGNETDALNAFGLITQNTTGDVGSFLTRIRLSAKQLNETGISVDQFAIALTAMENELGLTADTAGTEFRGAVKAAQQASDDGTASFKDVMAALGLTEAQMQKYSTALENSGGAIQELSNAHAATKTPLEQLQSRFSDLTFTMGPYIQKAASIAPLLMAIGPALAALSAAKKIYTTVTATASFAARAFGVAIRFAMGPIGLIIIAITALVAAGVLIWKNWDTISEKAREAWGKIKDVFAKGKDFVMDILSSIGKGVASAFTAGLNAVISGLNRVLEVYAGVVRKAKTLLDKLPGSNPLGNPLLAIAGALEKGIPQLQEGVRDFQGGLAVVGERGAEVVNLPRGSDVFPSGALPAVTVQVFLDDREISARALTFLGQELVNEEQVLGS